MMFLNKRAMNGVERNFEMILMVYRILFYNCVILLLLYRIYIFNIHIYILSC